MSEATETVTNEARKATAAARGGPKWETEARERLKAAMRKFSRPLADLVSRDANEGDTRLLVTDFLCDGFGFDKYNDLTTEYSVKGEFADYGVRIDQQLVAFIEVKRATTKLGAKHLRQVYAVNEGVEWMILTNGQHWQVYHLSPGMPVQIDLALDVNILGEEPPAKKLDKLFYLSRDSMKRRQMDELWKAQAATSPKSLVEVITSDPILDAIRRELRKRTGHNADIAEIRAALRASVFRTEALD